MIRTHRIGSIIDSRYSAPKFTVAGAEQRLNVLSLVHVSLHRDGAAARGLAGLDDFGRSGGV